MEFCKSKVEASLVSKIAGRASTIMQREGKRADVLAIQMDVEACHCNGNPLRLNDLLAAREFDFVHDVFGIQRHIDRATGALCDCFSPRYSA